jgi:hypothetical protein
LAKSFKPLSHSLKIIRSRSSGSSMVQGAVWADITTAVVIW